MPTVQINSKVQFDLRDIISSMTELELPDLEQFRNQLNLIIAQKKAPNLSKRETELLLKINQVLSNEQLSRYEALKVKMEEDNISLKEHKELLSIVKEMEVIDVVRLEALVELSQIRGISVQQLMKDLGIKKDV